MVNICTVGTYLIDLPLTIAKVATTKIGAVIFAVIVNIGSWSAKCHDIGGYIFRESPQFKGVDAGPPKN